MFVEDKLELFYSVIFIQEIVYVSWALGSY